jgi:predicted Fe-Mo cluster-binding NifX family protein/Co/Zn/Cd efflux system component
VVDGREEYQPAKLVKETSCGGSCTHCHQTIISRSFFVNLIALFVKGAVGIVTGSQALIADAVHSVADTVAFGLMFASSRRQIGRSAVASAWVILLTGTVVFLSAVWICADNISLLVGGVGARPGLLALLVAALSVGANGYLYWLSRCVDRHLAGANVRVCMVQNRVNFIAAGIAFAGVSLSALGFPLFDPFGALLIGGILFAAAFEIFRLALQQGAMLTSQMKGAGIAVVLVISCVIIGYYTHMTIRRHEVVLIPSAGLATISPMHQQLARAPYFLVFNTRENTVRPVVNGNRFTPGNVDQSLVDIVRHQNVDVVLAQNINPQLYQRLRDAGVRMYYAPRGTLAGQTVHSFTDGKLPAATEPNIGMAPNRKRSRWWRRW